MRIERLRDERGGVLLIVAVGLFALIFLVAFVIDVGNWKEHKRHLQLQADAAALAGAGSFALPNCTDATVTTAARDYAGTDATYLALYNDQVASKYDGTGHVPNLHILVNSLGYYGDPGAGNNTGGSPCATSPANQFCGGAQGVDIKATETDLPWFFGGLVPKIHAHARACLMQQTSSANSLPIAVPNPKPTKAAAIFIDYGNGNAILGSPLELTDCPACSGPSGLKIWASADGGTNVPVAARTGLVIAISGRPDMSLSGTLSEICLQPLTTCFDATNDPSTVGVSFIRGWTNSGTGQQPDPPVLRDVQLFPGTCPVDPFGNAYFQYITGGCSLTIAAIIDARKPDGSDISPLDITVTGAGCPSKGCDLAKDNSVPALPECAAVKLGGATGRCFRGSIPIRARAGAQRLALQWHESTGSVTGQGDCAKGNGCNGSFPDVQQAYTADDLPGHDISGPLQIVQINHCPPPAPSACLDPGNSLPLGTQKVAVTIGLRGELRNAQSAADPTASCTFDDGTVHQFACLKVTVTNAGSGSTQSVNCDPLSNPKKDLEDQLATGCGAQYIVNTGTACPSANILETLPQPWNCTELFTGNKTPTVSDGLNRRIFGTKTPGACPAYGENGHNNWNKFNPADPPLVGFPQGDRRIVGVYLTAYGAFTHTSGTSLTIPVTDFGTFYITGYDGSPCAAGSPTATVPYDDPVPNKGTIVGHFIKYVDRLNTGGGTMPCDPNSFGSCVPVMTK